VEFSYTHNNDVKQITERFPVSSPFIADRDFLFILYTHTHTHTHDLPAYT